jgi:hypothetical protein
MGWDGITLPTYAARDPAHIVFKLFENARHFFFLFRLMTSPKFTI